MKTYRIHLTGGDILVVGKAEAFRQAKNLARACQGDIWVTEEVTTQHQPRGTQ